MKIQGFAEPFKTFSLGPCPDDRAQHSVQDSLNESSVRPNPTLVFSNSLFQFGDFLAWCGGPWSGPFGVYLAGQNWKFQFIWDIMLDPTWTIIVLFSRQVVQRDACQDKKQMGRRHMGASLLSFVPTYMTNGHHRKDGKGLEGKEPIDFVTRTEATGVSRLSGGDFFEPKRR